MEYAALFVCMMAGAMSLMHNVLRGGRREDGSHVETSQEAVDKGTPWAALCLAAGVVGVLLLML